MRDKLAKFRDEGSSDEESAAEATVSHDLLVFELVGERFGVFVAAVDAVIPWREPVPLPQGADPVAGVVQDRGRIVVVLRHPLGRADSSIDHGQQRLLVCETPRGFVGLPAGKASSVGAVAIAADLCHGTIVDTQDGPLRFVDPEILVRDLVS